MSTKSLASHLSEMEPVETTGNDVLLALDESVAENVERAEVVKWEEQRPANNDSKFSKHN